MIRLVFPEIYQWSFPYQIIEMTTDGPGVSLFRYNAIAFFILCAPMARQGDGVELIANLFPFLIMLLGEGAT